MSWEVKKLDDVCEIRAGNSAPQDKKMFNEGTYPFFRTSDVGKIHIGFIKDSADKLNDFGINKLTLYKKGTLLFPKSGASTFLNHRVLMTVDGYVSSHLATLKANNSILDDRFLFYFSLSIDSRELMQDQNYPSLRLSDIQGITILIPPLSEQKRIVSILDEAFENITKAKENAEKNLKNAKEIFESYLQSVFENKGEGWEDKKIGEICKLMTGGTPSRNKKEYFEGGIINWLVSGDVNLKEINYCDGKITEDGLKNSNAKYLPLNSVIIALNGQGKTRGTVAMLRIKATCNQSLVSIYPNNTEMILPEYIYYNLDSRYNEIRKITGDSGNDRRGLNMPLIKNINISYPKSIDQQKKYIVKFKELKKNTKKLESIYNQELTDLEELKQSILQKAFKGELTEVSA